MLLEGWRVAKSLREAQIDAEPRASSVATPGKTGGMCLRLLVSHDLKLNLLPVSDEEREASLWTFRQGNFHFWPIVRVDPLCASDDAVEAHRLLTEVNTQGPRDEREDKASRLRTDLLRAATPNVRLLADAEFSERVYHEAKLRALGGPLQELGLRLSNLTAPIKEFLGLFERFFDEPSISGALFGLYFGRIDKARVGSCVQVAFDLAEQTIFEPELRAAVERTLAKAAPADEGPNVLKVPCALSGQEQQRHVGKFPNPAIPVVAPSGIAMFSMFSDAPTNTRYGFTDDQIVCIGADTVQASQDGLKYITDPRFKGKHWLPFPNGKHKDRSELSDLLIAYVDGLPLGLAEGLGELESEAEYEDTAKQVLDALRVKAHLAPETKVLLILLRQVSHAQVQSVYNRTPTAKEVYDAASRWMSAQQGRPALVTQFKKAGVVSPARTVRLLSKTWTGRPPNGQHLSGPTGGDILDFFLSESRSRKELAAMYLRQLLQRHTALFTYAGQQGRLSLSERTDEREGSRTGPADRKQEEIRQQADLAATLLTILLVSMGRTMEISTESPTYELGLLLGIVDTLHLAYNQAVRGEKSPVSLGGAQLLGIAADSPSRALSELLERVRPWSTWAKGASDDGEHKQSVLRAKKALHRLGLVSPRLNRLPCSLDDIGRAELLLGYLSRDSRADIYKENGETND